MNKMDLYATIVILSPVWAWLTRSVFFRAAAFLAQESSFKEPHILSFLIITSWVLTVMSAHYQTGLVVLVAILSFGFGG